MRLWYLLQLRSGKSRQNHFCLQTQNIENMKIQDLNETCIGDTMFVFVMDCSRVYII